MLQKQVSLFHILPNDHPNLSKILSFDGFTSPLTKNDINQPVSFEIKKPYPNPFNPSITLDFVLNNPQEISIKIYNIDGRFIETLIKEKLVEGKYSINWNAENNASGVYFIQTKTQDIFETQKVVLIK